MPKILKSNFVVKCLRCVGTLNKARLLNSFFAVGCERKKQEQLEKGQTSTYYIGEVLSILETVASDGGQFMKCSLPSRATVSNYTNYGKILFILITQIPDCPLPTSVWQLAQMYTKVPFALLRCLAGDSQVESRRLGVRSPE